MKPFWNLQTNGEERVLRLEGEIANDVWWGDEITPDSFKKDLYSATGDITVWINSPGGGVFAAAQIYNMLMEYPGRVTVKIDGIAASAASVVAMAGDEVLMSPVSYMIIHNPATIAFGDSAEMLRTKATLDEIKEGIINAYEIKSKLPRSTISGYMDEESCFSAKKAVELGFADGVLYSDRHPKDTPQNIFMERLTVFNSIMNRKPNRTDTSNTFKPYYKRLERLKYQGGSQ